jgi:hypothetical protein
MLSRPMPQTQLGYLSVKPIQDLRAYARETEGQMAAQCARAWPPDQRLFRLCARRGSERDV